MYLILSYGSWHDFVVVGVGRMKQMSIPEMWSKIDLRTQYFVISKNYYSNVWHGMDSSAQEWKRIRCACEWTRDQICRMHVPTTFIQTVWYNKLSDDCISKKFGSELTIPTKRWADLRSEMPHRWVLRRDGEMSFERKKNNVRMWGCKREKEKKQKCCAQNYVANLFNSWIFFVFAFILLTNSVDSMCITLKKKTTINKQQKTNKHQLGT